MSEYRMTPKPNVDAGVSLGEIIRATQQGVYQNPTEFNDAVIRYFDHALAHEPADERAAARYTFKRDLNSQEVPWKAFYTAMIIMGQQVTMVVDVASWDKKPALENTSTGMNAMLMSGAQGIQTALAAGLKSMSKPAPTQAEKDNPVVTGQRGDPAVTEAAREALREEVVKVMNTPTELDPMLMNISIESLKLPKRIANVLMHSGEIATIGQLIQASPKEMARIRFLGDASHGVVIEALQRFIYNSMVSNLSVSPKSLGCLAAAGIKYIGELVQMDELELLSYPDFPQQNLEEIKTALAKINLNLGVHVQNWTRPE